MDKKKIIRSIKRYIALLKQNKYAIQKVYLFGSIIKGKSHKDSDIDIAVIIKNLTNSFNTQVQLMKLVKNIDSRIEPHPFDEKVFNSSNPFAAEIIKTGKQII